MLVCSNFLISVCMFIVSKASLISSATVIVRAGGAIWLIPFATVLFTVCSVVTVECILYEMPLSMSLLGIGMGTMFSNFHMCGIMLVLRAVLNILVRNSNPRGPMCFKCLIFNFSRPCELLFLLCFIASWTWVVVSVVLCPCIFVFLC